MASPGNDVPAVVSVASVVGDNSNRNIARREVEDLLSILQLEGDMVRIFSMAAVQLNTRASAALILKVNGKLMGSRVDADRLSEII